MTRPLRSDVEGFEQRMSHGPRAGWRDTIGAHVTRVEKGSVTVELTADDRHRHEGGVVQGGIITQIADSAMAMSLMTLQPDDMTNLSIELKINFLRPVVEGRVRAVGRIVEMKKSLYFAEADVFDEHDRLVARASSSCIPAPMPAPE